MDTAPLDHIDRLIDVARGVADVEPDDIENRNTRRVEFDANLAFVQWTPQGGKSISTIVRGRNISSNGLCVTSRYMLHVGHEGVLLVKRSDGEPVMLGARVVHCRYVGEMRHESGLEFIEIPGAFSLDDFRDEHGHMPDLGCRAA